MKKYNFTLNIEKPCNEEWTSMTVNGVGKYCSSCSKNVIDFSQLSDNEIIEIVTRSEENLCGRFRKDQLNRLLIQTAEKSTSSRLYKVLAGLLLLSASDNITAREETPKIEIVSSYDQEVLPEEKDPSQPDSLKNVIQGTVVDARSKEPVPYVNVIILNSPISIATDKNGKFKIQIPAKFLTDEIAVRMSHPEYETIEFNIASKSLPVNLTKELSIHINIMMRGGLMPMRVPAEKEK